MVFFLCGCGGSPNLTGSNTYVISGTISPASVGSGATLILSGLSRASTNVDSSGNYSFTGLTNGVYVVTPTRAGYSFNPALQTVTINGANVSGIDFSGSPQASHSVGLSWDASSSGVTGYNVYRGTSDGGPYSIINSGLITTLSYTDSSVSSSNTYFYVATSVDSAGVESIYSNQVTAKIP